MKGEENRSLLNFSSESTLSAISLDLYHNQLTKRIFDFLKMHWFHPPAQVTETDLIVECSSKKLEETHYLKLQETKKDLLFNYFAILKDFQKPNLELGK